jgi:magnesium chelatase family protein
LSKSPVDDRLARRRQVDVGSKAALDPAAAVAVRMIASVAGEIEGGALTARRPFRAPHHSASMAALTGGGMRAKPGEISLAHQGVLFLDELPEFDPRVLDSLRQPLENGEVAVSRANHRVTYPARFMLVAAMNPCLCGQAYEPGFSCKRGRIVRTRIAYLIEIAFIINYRDLLGPQMSPQT